MCLYIYVVFCCISLGYGCSEVLCKTWYDYVWDINGCRSNGGVDRLTTKKLSCVPFIGFSSFYRGNIFDGCCEVINTVMAVVSLLTPLCCTRHITNGISVYIAVVTIILDLAKIYHIIIIGPVDMYEIVILIASYILFILYCRYLETTHVRVNGIILALLVTITTGIIETFRDAYTAEYNSRDGSDCPFV